MTTQHGKPDTEKPRLALTEIMLFHISPLPRNNPLSVDIVGHAPLLFSFFFFLNSLSVSSFAKFYGNSAAAKNSIRYEQFVLAISLGILLRQWVIHGLRRARPDFLS